jgi:hypothetical protein
MHQHTNTSKHGKNKLKFLLSLLLLMIAVMRAGPQKATIWQTP